MQFIFSLTFIPNYLILSQNKSLHCISFWFIYRDPLSSLTSKKKRPKPTYGDIRGIEWELFDIKKPRYLDMTIKNFEMKNFEEQNRMNLWNQLHVVYQAYLKDLEEKRNKVEPK